MSVFSDETEAFTLLAELVGIDSVNPVYGGKGESEVVTFICAWLSRRKIAYELREVAPGRSNVISRIGPAGAPALLLEAHMDTVGVGGWSEGSPFELRRRGDRYFGRGACDTKASLASFMLILAHFADNQDRLGQALVFAATVDEESEQIGAFELAKLKDELGFACAITGEPTRSDVISKHKGVGRYLMATRGKAAHASSPELGDNAIYKAAKLCGDLERLALELGDDVAASEIDRGTLNTGSISGGIGFNIVPDFCQVDIDRRFGASESIDEARKQLERICESVAGAEFSVFLERPPLRGNGSGDFVSRLLKSGSVAAANIRERDAAYMTNAVAYEAVGVPSVVFGPGDIAQAHKNDEYIEAGEILKTLQILEAYLALA